MVKDARESPPRHSRPVPEPVEGPDGARLLSLFGRSLSLSKHQATSSTPQGTFLGHIVPPPVLQHVPGNVSSHFRTPTRAPLKHGPFLIPGLTRNLPHVIPGLTGNLPKTQRNL